MATIHICDCCGAEVGSRSDLWEVMFARVSAAPVTRTAATSKVERFELCDRCKKRAYTACNEAPPRRMRKGEGTP